MIDCNKFFLLISDFIDEELEEEIVLEIRSHIKTCPTCQNLHESFLHIIRVFQCQCALEVPPAAHEQLWQTLKGILEQDSQQK
ncbi:MAG: zf-HC2 domain-containing protein [candidate division WOR-3 bacterium]|nr:zf-HC2 domain-containing protein [candidate division WOR-3 bacterium]